MALSPAVLATLRSQVQGTAKVHWYLALAPYGDPIFTGVVNDAGIAKSARTIAYAGAGDTEIRAGMTLWVGSDAGLYDEGKVRIRGLVLEFNSGSTQFWYDEVLTGAITGHTARVISWVVTGGTWAGGDAAGVVYVDRITGNFQAAENLNGSVGGLNIATAVAAIDSIQVAENDDIAWTNGFHLTCPGEAGFHELWGILPRITEAGGVVTFYEDYDRLYYDGFDDVLPPKANAGPPVCAFLNDAGYAYVDFVGEESFTTEVGAAIAAYHWDFADGAIVQGDVGMMGTCEIPNIIRFNTPGFRYVTLTVTDNTAAVRTGTVYIPVWIFDRETAPPLSVEVLSQEGRPNWQLRVRAFATDSALTEPFYDYPDGALCVLFVEVEWVDGDTENVGGFCGRENVRFVGWLDGESLTFNYEGGTCDFTAISHDMVMQRLPGFPYTLEDSDAPDDWYEVDDFNLDRALHAHLERRSTVNQVCHVETLGEGSNRVMALQGFEDGSVYSQAQNHLLSDAMTTILSDRQGILKVRMDPQMQDAVDRAAVEVLATLTAPDLLGSVDQIKPKSPSVGMVRLGGFAYDTPLLSQAPGDACAQQESTIYKEGYIVRGQPELNLWSGCTMTKGNLEFPQVPVELIGYWPVFDPADQEYVQLTVTDPLSRNVWTTKKFIVRGMAFGDLAEAGTTRTELILEEENDILYGETQTIPVAPTPASKIYNPPPPPVSPPNWCGGLERVILRTNQGIFITENFDALVPTDVYWEASNNNFGVNQRQNIVDMAFDYQDGERLFAVVEDFGAVPIAQADKGLFRCADVFGGAAWELRFDGDWPQQEICITGCGAGCGAATRACPPPWGTGAGAAVGVWRSVGCDVGNGNLLFIGGVYEAGADSCRKYAICFHSEDALQTLTCGPDFLHIGQGHLAIRAPDDMANGCLTSFQGIGLFNYSCAWAAGGDRHRAMTWDNGVTIDTGNPPGTPSGEVWAQNSNIWHTRADEVVFFYTDEGGDGRDLAISGDHGFNFTVWTPNILPATPAASGQALTVHFLDHAHLMFIDNTLTVWYCVDGGFTWAGAAAGPNNPWAIAACADTVWPIPDGFGYITGAAQPTLDDEWVFLTRDMGLTWENRTGNLGDYLDHTTDVIWQIIPVQVGC